MILKVPSTQQGYGMWSKNEKGPVNEWQFGDKSSVIKHFGIIWTTAEGGIGDRGAVRWYAGGTVVHAGGLLMDDRKEWSLQFSSWILRSDSLELNLCLHQSAPFWWGSNFFSSIKHFLHWKFDCIHTLAFNCVSKS